MGQAYEGNETRILAQSLGFKPIVPPVRERAELCEYDAELYKHRNEIEQRFDRIKRFRRVFIHYGKTNLMFTAFIIVALIANLLLLCELVLVGQQVA